MCVLFPPNFPGKCVLVRWSGIEWSEKVLGCLLLPAANSDLELDDGAREDAVAAGSLGRAFDCCCRVVPIKEHSFAYAFFFLLPVALCSAFD